MIQKILKEQFDVLLDAPESIPKLREMILQLAVMGKLVPQDPNEEPAREFLKRIRDDNEKGIGIGKPSGRLPATTEAAEIPFPPLQGWEWATFDLVAKIETNLVPPLGKYRTFPHIAPNHIEKDSGRLLEYSTVSDDDVRSGKHLFQSGRILYSKIRPNLNKVVIVDFEGLCSADMYPILPRIVPQFLHRFMLSPVFLAQVVRDDNRVAMPKVNQEQLSAVQVAVPPLAEQKRIVEKVDRLMAFCDELEARQNEREKLQSSFGVAVLGRLTDVQEPKQFSVNLNRVKSNFDLIVRRPEDVKKVRETILQLAVMGKLVPQDPNDEPASELLKRIRAEKEKLIAEGKIKKAKELPAVREDEKPFPLPEGWEWARLETLILGIQAGWSPTCEERPAVFPEWGVVKVSAVTWDDFDPRQNKRLPDSLEARPELEIMPGDFLITRANTAELVAKSVVVKATQKRLLLSDKTLRVVFSRASNRLYVNRYNSSVFARQYYARVAGGTSSSMKNVSQEQIRALPIPVGPIGEQKRIVEKVDRLMAFCDELETGLARSRQEGTRLLEAVVAAVGSSVKI